MDVVDIQNITKNVDISSFIHDINNAILTASIHGERRYQFETQDNMSEIVLKKIQAHYEKEGYGCGITEKYATSQYIVWVNWYDFRSGDLADNYYNCCVAQVHEIIDKIAIAATQGKQQFTVYGKIKDDVTLCLKRKGFKVSGGDGWETYSW